MTIDSTPQESSQHDANEPRDASGAPTGAESATGSTVDSQGAEILRLSKEAAEFKDKYVRAYADMENIRRRYERERGDLVRFALEQAFKDFLPVLDSFEKALPESADLNGLGDSAAFAEGMVMIKRQLLEVFKKHGLEVVSAAGVAFDPNLHQAIQRIESDAVEVETVDTEFARGYVLNGRLLRPAMVSVLAPTGG